MTTQIGFGPLYAIDGPPPLAPKYGLIPAAAAPADGVRIVPDGDDGGIERWGNGAEVWPYPSDTGHTWAFTATGSEAGAKLFGDEEDLGENPQFDSFTAYLPVTCPSWKVSSNPNEFTARAVAAFEAVESSIIAREFMHGTRLPQNPYLSDGAGLFPNADTATSIRAGVSLLEQAIADTGRQGLIHISPAVLSAFANPWEVDKSTGVIRTAVGTVVLPDAGYSRSAAPVGHTPVSGTLEWIYATGPIDIRRQATPTIVPVSEKEALDRTGALTGRPNRVTYRVERDYLVTWDRQLQAAVLVDRCKDSC